MVELCPEGLAPQPAPKRAECCVRPCQVWWRASARRPRRSARCAAQLLDQGPRQTAAATPRPAADRWRPRGRRSRSHPGDARGGRRTWRAPCSTPRSPMREASSASSSPRARLSAAPPGPTTRPLVNVSWPRAAHRGSPWTRPAGPPRGQLFLAASAASGVNRPCEPTGSPRQQATAQRRVVVAERGDRLVQEPQQLGFPGSWGLSTGV